MSNESVRTFIEDLQGSAGLWNVHCADYKNRNRKGDRLIFLQKKKMKSLLPKLGEILPLAKYLSVTANLIAGGIVSRNFVSFPWILGPVFWCIISKSLFVILAKFLYPELSSICSSRKRSYPC